MVLITDGKPKGKYKGEVRKHDLVRQRELPFPDSANLSKFWEPRGDFLQPERLLLADVLILPKASRMLGFWLLLRSGNEETLGTARARERECREDGGHVLEVVGASGETREWINIICSVIISH